MQYRKHFYFLKKKKKKKKKKKAYINLKIYSVAW